MSTLIGGLLLAVLSFMFSIVATAFSWLLRLLWPVWLTFAIFWFLAASAQPAQAGWFDWLWGSDTAQLERAAEIAQEAARVANSTVQAQATQNARIAELLSHLSEERQGLAGYLTTLADASFRDSKWAAALSATSPVVITAGVLLVAGMALWTVGRTGHHDQAELCDALDFLAMEVAAYGQAHAHSGPLLANHSIRAQALPGPSDDWEEDVSVEPNDEDPNDPPPF